jgi:CRISPR-associated protein Cmr1
MSIRKLPSADVPVWKHPPQTEHTQLTVALKTITPLFGGSGKAGEVDKKNPIRAASIKGHLRFWWRATTGASFTDLKTLQDKEDALFGKAVNTEDEGHESNVDVVGNALRVRVVVTNKGTEQKCGEFDYPREHDGSIKIDKYTQLPTDRYKAIPDFVCINPHDSRDKRTWPGYALQPFQGQLKQGGREIEREPSVALLNVRFQIILNYPQEHQTQIEQAIAAWIFFGGVGARSRRGCGSIALDRSVLPSISTPNESTLGIEDNDLLTKTPARYYIGNETENALIAWETAVNIYKDFRQKAGPENRGVPGLSCWPEPHSIRRISRRSSQGHEPPHRDREGAFPRADLGLPIIFQFKQQDERNGDPHQHTLEGRESGQTRFASPVITKAHQLPNGKFVPMIAILDSPRVWALGNLSLSGTPITPQQVQDTACPPMSEVGKTDIRDGLIEYAKRRGLREFSL